jgi:hypothetical protein
VSRAFRNLKADEVLNFSVAVTVMRVQRKWRARMRAAKLKRKREVCGWSPQGLGAQADASLMHVCNMYMEKSS